MKFMEAVDLSVKTGRYIRRKDRTVWCRIDASLVDYLKLTASDILANDWEIEASIQEITIRWDELKDAMNFAMMKEPRTTTDDFLRNLKEKLGFTE